MIRSRIDAVIKRILQSRILRRSSALMVSNFATQGILFLLSLFLAKKLGADDYGLMLLSMTIVKGVMNFLDLKSDDAIVRFMGEALAKEQKQEAITVFYVGLIADAAIMVATVVILFAAMPVISGIYGNNELLMSLVRIYILSLPFSLLDNLFSTVLVVVKRYYLLAWLVILNSLVTVACVVGLSSLGDVVMTMWGYVLAAVVVFVGQVALGTFVLYREVGTFKGKDFAVSWRRFLPFAFHTNLTGYLKAVGGNVDILILGAVRPAAEVSFYKIARSATQLMGIPISPVSTVIYPSLNEAWAQQNERRARDLIGRFFLFTGTISVVAMLGLLVLADPAVLLVYGSEFAPTANLIRVLAIGSVFAQLNSIAQPVMFANGRPDLNTYQKLGSSILKLVLSVLLIPLLGAIGAGVGFTTSAIIIFMTTILLIFPVLGIWRPANKQAADVTPTLLK
jgi:O-antigen/teichoic acid export membrane protein